MFIIGVVVAKHVIVQMTIALCEVQIEEVHRTPTLKECSLRDD